MSEQHPIDASTVATSSRPPALVAAAGGVREAADRRPRAAVDREGQAAPYRVVFVADPIHLQKTAHRATPPRRRPAGRRRSANGGMTPRR